MLTNDEKHELILAHAAAREGQKQGWGLGYYVGVVASCLVVATGWWFTLGTTLRLDADADRPGSFSQILQKNVDKFQKETKEEGADLDAARAIIQENAATIEKRVNEVQIQEAAMRRTAEELNRRAATTTNVLK